MNLIVSIPIEARLAAALLLGTCLGSAVNLAIYRLAWYARPISPWSRPDSFAPPRRWCDRLPIFGWLGLRREAMLHGAGFWIRPMLLELLAGIGLAWLYWWEVGAAGLLPPGLPHPLPAELLSVLHLEFAAHTVLIALMLAASLIDVDEKIIPDEITIPGTLVGLLVAAMWPWSLLPDVLPQGRLDFLRLDLAERLADVAGRITRAGDRVGLLVAVVGGPVAALVVLATRLGPGNPALLRRVARQRVTYRILRMAVMGSLAIALVWYHGEQGWQGLLSALVGMAASGGLVWLVRIIGTAALHREAMGFGDVTLMAMIGAYLGWQPCLMIFFLAPFAGLAVGILRLILFRDKEIPYGPFLCLATLLLIVRWHAVWDYTWNIFALGWLVPLVMLGCLALMALMLTTWRLILSAFR